MFQTLYGQAKDVYDETCIEWEKNLIKLLTSYKEISVFNLNETEPLNKCMVCKIIMCKNETCSGNILNKKWLTLTLGTRYYWY